MKKLVPLVSSLIGWGHAVTVLKALRQSAEKFNIMQNVFCWHWTRSSSLIRMKFVFLALKQLTWLTILDTCKYHEITKIAKTRSLRLLTLLRLIFDLRILDDLSNHGDLSNLMVFTRSLNYCFFANQRVLFFAMPFLPCKGFALTDHLKTAKCECLWSSRTGDFSSSLLLKIKQFCSS